MLTVAACSDVRNTPDLPPPDVYGQLSNMDLSARAPQRAGVGQYGDPQPRAASYMGRADTGATFDRDEAAGAAYVAGAAPAAADGTQGGYQLNFENAPIQSVVKAVLGDTLGLGYDIDPRVQGSISLSFARPLERNQVLFALENALRLSNVALVKGPGGYRVIPLGEAVGQTALNGSRGVEPGFGLSVFPLRYVTAATMMKLLDGFATKPGAIRVDTTRNLLLIAGTGEERQNALRTAESFDAEFMRGQSVGIYPLRSASPKVMIAELENIMTPGGESPDQALIKFQPVDRLNAILVVTRQPALLNKAGSWISRLDRNDPAESGIKVYRVRYGDAKHIAGVLTALFRGSSGSGDTLGQTAPGSGTQTTRSDALAPLSTLGGSGAAGTGTGTTLPGRTTVPAEGGNSPFGALNVSGLSTIRPSSAAATDSTLGDADLTQGAGAAVRVTADPATNSLLISANRQDFQAIQRTLLEIDRPALQVAIEATIAEVTLNNSLNYGVQYFLKSQDLGLGRNNGSAGLSANSVLNGMITKVLPGANLLLGPDTDPRVVLDALRAYTDVKVISSPSLVVLDNQVATLQVGDSVPVATSSATLVSAAQSNTPVASVGFPVANTIDYRNTGVILRVLPRVNFNGNVSLDIEQEISSIVPSATAETLTPTVSERKIKSSIAVASEQTVLLAGLISDTQNTTRSGLPIIERIQGIGDLFSSNSRAHARTELIIFIRPKIIRDGNDASDVAEALRGRILQSDGLRPSPDRRPLFRKF